MEKVFNRDAQGKPYLSSPQMHERKMHKNGLIKEETYQDGGQRIWYESGQMKYQFLPNADILEMNWLEDGTLKRQVTKDGSEKEFFDNGQIKRETLQFHGTFEHLWDENGNRIKSNGSIMNNKEILEERLNEKQIISENIQNGDAQNWIKREEKSEYQGLPTIEAYKNLMNHRR